MSTLRIVLYLFICIIITGPCYAHPVTVLVPSEPVIDNEKKSNHQNGTSQDEVDVLIALMHPYTYASEDMDRPQFMAAMYYSGSGTEPELRNLLGDVERIRYNGKNAWGVNVGLEHPGLYQFVLEAKPWWDPASKSYLSQQAKVVLPVRSDIGGWDSSFGQSFEILPVTRPFGLVAPALFSARILLDGKPLANLPIFMTRLNPDGSTVANHWQENMESRSNGEGQFSFVLNKDGWWCCEANINGEPLKGPDGEMSPVRRSTVLWIYVTGASPRSGKKS